MWHVRYSIIIPAPSWGEWAALAAIRDNPPDASFEIIVALGRHPAVQRNEALRRSRGSVIVFLDSDSSISRDYWQVLEMNLKDESVDILGGPSLLRMGYNAWEPIFQELLTNPFIVGPMSHRYKPAAINASASQADLILCNLVARRTVFDKIGTFSSHLFPNEENEWLDRATRHGLKILYQPDLQVSRPQRKTVRQFFCTMIRYGIGRTHQFQVSRQFALPMLVPLVLIMGLLGWLGAVWFLGWALPLSVALSAYVGLGALQGLTSLYLSVPRPTAVQALAVAILGPMVPVAYGMGQMVGWSVRGAGLEAAAVQLVDERNRAI